MLQLFRQLMMLLAFTAPGQVGCDRPIAMANECWVSFENPSYVEYVKPGDHKRIVVLIQLKRMGE